MTKGNQTFLSKSREAAFFLRNPYQAGDKYGYAVLTGKAFISKGIRKVEAICVCGKIWFTQLIKFKRGETKSCGCKGIEARTKHGMTKKGTEISPIYKAWMNMKKRCYWQGDNAYEYYGRRGIVVCEEWKNDFLCFHNWAVNNGWARGLSLDRIDNDGGYGPNNCRWATIAIQQRNRRINIFLEDFGEKKCSEDWANDQRCVVSRNTMMYRIDKLKWNAERAISEPNMNKGDRKNRSDTLFVEYNGEVKRLFDWCTILGLKYLAIRSRLKKSGWDVDKAFQTKLRING